MGKVQKRIFIGVIAFFMLLCIGFLLTPQISNWIYTMQSREVIEEYSNVVSAMDEDELDNYIEEAKSYNEYLYNGSLGDSDLVYEDMLNFNDSGQMGIVVIPKIGVNLPIYHSVDDDVLHEGAGHMPESSLPIGGVNTHSVISAHTAQPGRVFFDDLPKLEEGDIFYISVLGEKMYYKVINSEVVEPDDLSLLEIEDDKDLASLLTCYPYAVNTHRLIVTGERVLNNEVEVVEEEITPVETTNYGLIIGIVVGVIILAVLFIVIRKIRKKKPVNEE
jgi:sortase family protein